jgi:molybdate transport system substrate-binding protein
VRAFLALLAGALVSLAILSCGGIDRAGEVDLTVAGAASLRDALTEAGGRYELDHAGAQIRLAFDASSALRSQIEQGAPVDVFVSADRTNPQALVDHGLAVGPVAVVARNRLVIVVPRSGTVVATPLDLARPGVKVIAAAPEVPISKYATQLIAQLAGQPGYPVDYADRVAANVVSREDNVKAIVAKVDLGEGDAGIVYATDAAGSSVATIEIPGGTNVIATYGGVVTTASRLPAQAQSFLGWLAGPEGQAVLARFGFLPAAA